jgi:general secretion pathway protein G
MKKSTKEMLQILVGVLIVLLGLAILYSIALVRLDGYGPAQRTRAELTGLSNAIVAFQEEFGVSHLPSRIKLSETCNYPQRDRPNTLDADSVHYLQRLWPRLRLEPGTRIDWNGDGEIQEDHVLEGDECLVFFVGGIPSKGEAANGCLGFSKEGKTPAEPGGERVGLFFEFRSWRLRDLHGRGFFTYVDGYGKQPYAYFSNYGQVNGYNRYGDTDCPSLGVWPYAETLTPPRFLNQHSFQIISAGPDLKFGPGTDEAAHAWNPRNPAIPPQGRDDLGNFSWFPLGKPQK